MVSYRYEVLVTGFQHHVRFAALLLLLEVLRLLSLFVPTVPIPTVPTVVCYYI